MPVRTGPHASAGNAWARRSRAAALREQADDSVRDQVTVRRSWDHVHGLGCVRRLANSRGCVRLGAGGSGRQRRFLTATDGGSRQRYDRKKKIFKGDGISELGHPIWNWLSPAPSLPPVFTANALRKETNRRAQMPLSLHEVLAEVFTNWMLRSVEVRTGIPSSFDAWARWKVTGRPSAEPGVAFVMKDHRAFAFESSICREIFEGFNSPNFSIEGDNLFLSGELW
ncbi:hypothetical protein STAS_17179 [Striga asiatica]|uniref:Uncharacterized protein n=1 Tax=Striga asiatica TaxID=4170 RepID=A0A5A7Q6H4_STRAF|nr:hypothetical protein STAS_17179 [Striga asiatica]